MSSRQIFVLTIFAAVCGLLVCLFIWHSDPPRIQSDAESSLPRLANPTSPVPPEFHSIPKSKDIPSAREEISISFARLEKAGNGEASRQILDYLGTILASLNASEVADAVRDFLNENRDVVTNLAFVVGGDGNLSSSPTFRTWLLDQLGRLNPQAAADYSKTILTTHGSADEWAIALRNYARILTEPADQQYLQDKARELINDPRWQREQSIGWLEAFDVIVKTGATDLTPDLAGLVRKSEPQNKAVAHAAFLTLDRLVIADSLTVLSQLQARPELMLGREATRANYFARADVRDAGQRAVLEAYLLDSTRSPEELRTFCSIYPNANYMISKNLLTRSTGVDGADLAARDQAALASVEQWISDPRFHSRKAELNEIRRRLSEFVRRAQK